MTDESHQPIVQPSGLPSRTKLIIAFMVLDLIAVGVIVWLIVR